MVVTGTVTGSNFLTGGYVSAAGNIIGNRIFGNGSTLSSITGANVSGNVANATYATTSGTSSTITTNAQPNITSVGTLNSLAVTANVTGGNILTAGQISSTGNITTAGYFVGTLFGNVTGNITIPGLNTQIIYNNNGNAGASSGLTFDSVSNAMVVSGNITGGNFLTGGYVSAVGNIIGSQFVGSGNTLSNIQGANVSGTVANATYALSSGYTATVTSNAQGNITSVGVLTNLSVTGNTQSGNLLTAGQISSTGNITTAGYFVGTLFGNVTGNITIPGLNTQIIYNNNGNAGASAGLTFNSASNAMVVSGNVTGGNFLTTGLISSTGTITGSSHLGAIVSVSGNVTAGYFIGNGSALSSITGANVSGAVTNATAAVYAATVTSNAQGNITSVGVLTNLSVTGNTQSGNLLTGGYVSATGNITTAGYFFGTFAGNISGNLTVPGSNTQVIYNNSGNAGASTGFTFDSAANAMVVSGNITGGNLRTAGLISSTGTITGSSFSGAGTGLTGTASSLTVGTATSATTAGTITTNAQPNITSVGTLSSLTVTANVTGGNLITGGFASITGTTYLKNTVYYGANSIQNIAADDTTLYLRGTSFAFQNAAASATKAQIDTNGNILTGGLVSATGNIQSSGNLSVAGNAVIVGSLTVEGNVTFIGSNVITTNNLYIELANNQSTYANINTAGLAVGPSGSPLTYWRYLNASNTWSTNVGISASGNVTSSNLSVGTGTITVGNIVNSNGNAVGNIGSSSNYFNTVFAQSTSALYADLAENYLADAQYVPGTVLSFGGEEELTISTQDNDSLIAGIVSTNPAYQMNSGLSGNFVVALTLSGRVPCLVQGPVTPGAMMVSAGNGRARAEVNPKMGAVIGKAITGFSGGKGVIEILVGRL
jgi:hypothetical protein